VHMRLRTREIQKALEKLHKKKNCIFVPWNKILNA
jgi:hypothetical protein